MKIRPATPEDVARVRQAIQLLRSARNLLRSAGCPQTLRRVRLCLTSAGGAERHVEHRARRAGVPHAQVYGP